MSRRDPIVYAHHMLGHAKEAVESKKKSNQTRNDFRRVHI